ncbi:MAG: heavy metal translocating P-type ATPase [Gammaproteobacteria bacterium]
MYQLQIEEMTCEHCVRRVKQALQAVDGVERVQVSLSNNRATVTGGQPHLAIEAATAAGYPAKPFVAACDIPANKQTEQQAVNSSFTASTDSYRIKIEDMTCASCVARVEKAITAVEGVCESSINLIEGIALVNGGDRPDVVNAIINSGYPAQLLALTSETTLRLLIEGSATTDIPSLIQTFDVNTQISDNSGGSYNIVSAKHPAAILAFLRQQGIQAHFLPKTDITDDGESATRREISLSWKRAIVAGTVGMGLMLLSMAGILPSFESSPQARILWSVIALLCLFVLYYSGRQYYIGAWKQARHGSSNMDTLVALGTAAAWIASVILLIWPDFIAGKKHLYLETSVIILAFLQFGHALEIRAKNKTRRAIRSLVELVPETATVIWQDKDYPLPLDALQPGDIVRIKPGERIPIDSEVINGKSSVDESMLTGESIPVLKAQNDALIGGTMNGNGALQASVSVPRKDAMLAKIIERVKQAQASKPAIGRLVDKVAGVFVPIVIVIAILTFTTWMLFGPEPRMSFALTAAIAVLVIACPCALGLATPIAIMIGTGKAAQSGILIRNGDALQAASGITHLILDKTGTLTQGKPLVTKTTLLQGTEEELLQLASSLETHSEHPLAAAVIKSAADRQIKTLPVSDFEAITGHGVRGLIDGKIYFLGNERLLQKNHISSDFAEIDRTFNGTLIYLASETSLLGVLYLQDPLRHDSINAVSDLKKDGIEIILCTGDNAVTANHIASLAGIHTVHSQVLPGEKAAIVQRLQQTGAKVAMAGDGINDAPALAQADVSFAIGAGSEVAIENADITLASDSLQSIRDAIHISKATMRNIRQNLFGAFIYNALGIPLAAGVFYPLFGWLLNPAFASAAMALSSVTVVTNANRLRFIKTGESSMPQTTLTITGMTCQNCVKHATEALEKVVGVESVNVSLQPGQAVVTGEATVEYLVQAVKDAGYEAQIND